MASKVVRIFDKVNKDPKEAWFSTSLSDVNNRINSAGIPANAEITKVRLYVNADFDGGGLGSPQVYLQFGFGSEGSISTLLMGDTKIGKDGANYPSNDGVEIPSTYVNKYSLFGFSSTIGARFVVYIHTAHILVTELTVNYADVVIEYNIPTYTATFKNYDGTTLQTVTVERGSTPSYTGSTPTRPQDAQYTYAFSGWSPAVGAITANTTYTAQYKATTRSYRVRWFNEDGTLLETDTTLYGVMPTYDGATPTKKATAEFSYTFKGWHIEVTTVTGEIDYYARYTETTNKYTVLWKNYDGTVLETDVTEYGKTPTYDGSTPQRPSTAQYEYAFLGWDTAVEEVTRDVVYTAIYTETLRKYTVEVMLPDENEGTIEGVISGEYEYGTQLTITVTPNRGYKFKHIRLLPLDGFDIGDMLPYLGDYTDNTITLTILGSFKITTVFDKLFRVEFLVNPENGGSIINTETGEKVESGDYVEGTMFTVKAVPNEKFSLAVFRYVDVDNESFIDINSDTYTFTVESEIRISTVFELVFNNKIQIGTEEVESIWYDESTKTIYFCISEVPDIEPTGADTVDGLHFAVTNTIPSGATEITGVQVGTTYVY